MPMARQTAWPIDKAAPRRPTDIYGGYIAATFPEWLKEATGEVMWAAGITYEATKGANSCNANLYSSGTETLA